MIIAIDGRSSTGKSTLAKEIARALHFVHVDSGAMYRAVTLYFLRNEIDLNDTSAINEALNKINIQFKIINGKNVTFLNGENVEAAIRTMKISSMVSEVARIPEVRVNLVKGQRLIAKDEDGIVMDGRDIGTVVFPNADIKFFVTADPDIRAQRRYEELQCMGKDISLDEVTHNLKHRDSIDTTRKHSPLVKSPDAIVIDNTFLSRKDQLALALKHIEEYRNKVGL